MNSSERRLEIFDLLLKNRTVDVGQLAEKFEVSTMTIRRDLAIYEKQGLLTTTYGGAVLNKEAVDLDAAPMLQSRFDLQTRKIGDAACRRLENGSFIFLDTGILAVAAALSMGDMALTVVTNSLDAANILRTFPRIKLMLTPGTFDEEHGGLISSSTIAYLRQFHFDSAILSSDYLDVTFGVSVEEETDAHIKSTVVECADSNIVLISSENIGKTAFAQAIPWRKMQLVITDENASPEALGSIEKRGVAVEVAQ